MKSTKKLRSKLGKILRSNPKAKCSDYLAGELAEKQAEIIDDFLLTYCASRNLKAKDIAKLKLIMKQTDNGLGYEYKFEIKRGKVKKQL